MYNTKPVHYTIMVPEELKCVIKEKDFFNVYSGKVKTLIFLRTKYINKYNNEMGGVGIAENIRN